MLAKAEGSFLLFKCGISLVWWEALLLGCFDGGVVVVGQAGLGGARGREPGELGALGDGRVGVCEVGVGEAVAEGVAGLCACGVEVAVVDVPVGGSCQ